METWGHYIINNSSWCSPRALRLSKQPLEYNKAIGKSLNGLLHCLFSLVDLNLEKCDNIAEYNKINTTNYGLVYDYPLGG